MANLGLQNKNPGNLKDPATGKFRVFNTPEEGQKALIDDIVYKQTGQSKHIKPGASLLELANVWAPASDNNVPENWAKNVARTIGANITDAFDKIPAEKLAEGIRAAEGTSTMPIGKNVMQTNQSELVKRVKAKYPQYNNIPDSELERRILAKYPQYKNLASGQVSQSQETPAFPFKAQDRAPVINTEQTQGTGIMSEFNKARDDFKQGNYLSALGHGASGAVRGISNFLTFGGSEQLGRGLGTQLAKNPEFSGQGGAKYVDTTGANDDIVKGGLKTAAGIALLASGGAAPGLLKNPFLRGTTQEVISQSLPRGLEFSKFMKLGNVEKLNILGDMLRTAQRAGMTGDAQVISKAIEYLSPQRSGLLSRFLKTGAKMAGTSILTAAGMEGGKRGLNAILD